VTDTSDELTALRQRIMAPCHVHRGTTVWAPWGKSGWSAVVIKTTQRKWAKGMRVKPKTGEETAKGKVPMDRLLRRDPELKGKDRPGYPPDEVFAHRETEPEVVEPEETEPRVAEDGLADWCTLAFARGKESPEQKKARLSVPGTTGLSEKEKEARFERLRKLLEGLDGSTTDDW
jgi:hypothetical protein